MSESWLIKINRLICKILGHKPDTDWNHEGKHFADCKRCHFIYEIEDEN